MARKLVQLAALVCDECDKHGIHDVDADTSHVFSIDGGRPKRFDFCPRSEEAIRFVLELYESHGVDVTPEEKKKKPARTKPAKAVPHKKTEALPAGPTPSESKEDKEALFLWCPEEHPSHGGKGVRLGYRNRNSHAQLVHHGARIWEIAWEDPDGILSFFCTAHAECLKTNLGFPSANGLAQHVRVCPLPRIDSDRPTNEASP